MIRKELEVGLANEGQGVSTVGRKELGPWPERPKTGRGYGFIKRSRRWVYGRSEKQDLRLVLKEENLNRVERAEAESRLTRRNVKSLLGSWPYVS